MIDVFPFSGFEKDIRFDETSKKLFYKDHEVSVLYYRSGYNIDHYSRENSELTKFVMMAGKSMAFSIPSVKSLLVNMKHFQKFIMVKDFQEKLGLKPEDLKMITYHTTDIKHIDLDFDSDKQKMLDFVLENPAK